MVSPTSSASAATTPWVAYQTDVGGNDRLHLVRTDGSQDHPIADDLPGRIAHPDFSRDGTRLVFDQLDSERAVDQLYVASGDGRDPRLVARCEMPQCRGHWEAAWSPDGLRLAMSMAAGPMTGTGPSRNGLALVDLATEHVTPLLMHPSRDGQDHFARWSPDGSMLVFWRERTGPDGSTQTAIFRVDASGKHLRQLTEWSLLAGDPDWSPDGSSVVFATRPILAFPHQGQSELFLMAPDGGDVRQLTHNGPAGPRAAQPRWTPDGQQILYVHASVEGFPRHLYTIQADGTEDAPLLTGREIYTHPAMAPHP